MKTVCLALLAFWIGLSGPAQAGAPTFAAVSVTDLPHDSQAFTQGLLYANGYFYESTGLYGRSTLRKVVPTTGQVLDERNLARDVFGEGLALSGQRLYQLSWKEGRVFVYQASDLRPVGELPLKGEGWGVCTVGDGRLAVSDGSNTLTFYDPNGFTPLATLAVTDDGKPVNLLNELETINGTIWANIWGEKRIAVIDPVTGHVQAWINCAALYPKSVADNPDAVLNGIASDAATGRIWITGKFWPVIHEIKVPGLPVRLKR